MVEESKPLPFLSLIVVEIKRAKPAKKDIERKIKNPNFKNRNPLNAAPITTEVIQHMSNKPIDSEVFLFGECALTKDSELIQIEDAVKEW